MSAFRDLPAAIWRGFAVFYAHHAMTWPTCRASELAPATRLRKTPCGRSGYGSSNFNITRRALRVLSTMSLVLSDVQRIAKLSQLELTPAEADATLDKLNGIFALVEQMRAIDTSGVEPLSHPIAAIEPALALRLREDAVTESNRREDYQQPAPATQDGLYLVPKVIE